MLNKNEKLLEKLSQERDNEDPELQEAKKEQQKLKLWLSYIKVSLHKTI